MSSPVRKADEREPTPSASVPVMHRRTIPIGVVVLVLVAVVSVSVLLMLFGGGTEQDKIRLEIVKLAGSIVIGTGGAVALWLAARRQRITELDLAHRERVAAETKAREEQVAADNRHDAQERRITDLYSAAGEQLGSADAPVRIAALLTLERLAQHNPDHRQPVIDLLCAYLRMPFFPPDTDDTTTPGRPGPTEARRLGLHPPQRRRATRSPISELSIASAAAATASIHDHHEQTRQELQVRLTAQRLITDHLRPDFDEDGNPTNAKFWKYIALDLTGATLIEWDMRACRARTCRFGGTTFHGHALFNQTTFQGQALFDRATFRKRAEFDGTTFQRDATFDQASFQRDARFRGATFQDDATFDQTAFQGHALFDRATLHSRAWFGGATFQSRARFGWVTFRGRAEFGWTTFQRDATFDQASFQRDAWFGEATFQGDTTFRQSTFQGVTYFKTTTFGNLYHFRDAKIFSPEMCYLPVGWRPHFPTVPLPAPFREWLLLVKEGEAEAATTS
ncbi:pentapeptide repeat-containing protein [Saccharopolyspora sp. NPDC050389]|uniref:pentapeptide repeat-containing protein n=1 Tax=Saccharopolyspora sp. NPDC050389 TaxID=3155516 RepID=UPI0033E14CA7